MIDEDLKAAGLVVGDTLILDTHTFEVAYLHGLLDRAADYLQDVRDDGPVDEGWQSDALKALRNEIASALGQPRPWAPPSTPDGPVPSE